MVCLADCETAGVGLMAGRRIGRAELVSVAGGKGLPGLPAAFHGRIKR